MLVNDFHVYAHPPVAVTPAMSVTPDFQITQEPLIVDNRVTTGPDAVNGVFDVIDATLTTGQGGGNELMNQNAAADINIWLPTLRSSEAIPAVGLLSPLQRVTANYFNRSVATDIANLQTVFLGHYVDRTNTPDFPLIRPYTYYSNKIVLDNGQSGQMYINVDMAYDLLVRAFFCRSPFLGGLITIQDRQYSLMNTPVFPETVAYRTLGETVNFKMPFVPWVAQRGHRYIINCINVSGQDQQTYQFAFWGQLCDYPQ
jgi:hypothetical protein